MMDAATTPSLMATDDSTMPEPRAPYDPRKAQLKRRIGLVALLLFLVIGATGLLGSHTSSAVAESNGYRLRVTYPAISRPGLPIRCFSSSCGSSFGSQGGRSCLR